MSNSTLFNTPILFLTYKRPELTEIIFEEIRKINAVAAKDLAKYGYTVLRGET